MITIFDLDDTLYDESTYVESCLKAVSVWLETNLLLPADDCFRFMMDTLRTEGRGYIFDRLLDNYGLISKSRILACRRVYRSHVPNISLYPDAVQILRDLSNKPLYLVTDGNKIMQEKKISALRLWPYFKKVFITYRYGCKYAKPSLHCFEIIKNREECRWDEMVYVGDDPAKDFVSLNRVGANTIRIMKGRHSTVQAKAGFDGKGKISCLRDLRHFL